MRIQCPDCAQRFTVDESLDGKLVECGGCDKRFRVTEEVLVRKPKPEFKASMRKEHQPGEVPVKGTQVAGRLKPEVKAPDVDYKEPIKPQQILGVILAIFLTAVVWFVFILGSPAGGVLQDVALERRYILAGSFAALVVFLFVLSFRNRRWAGFGVGLLFGGSLLVAPSLFEVIETPSTTAESVEGVELPDLQNSEFTVELPLEAERPLEERIGFKPMEDAFEKHGRGAVFGVLISGIDVTLTPQVRRYLKRRFNTPELPMRFNRASGDLFVVAPTEMGFDEVLETISEVGKVTEHNARKRVLALRANRELFELPPEGKLNSPSSPDFYRLNADELKAFDYERVKGAAERLTKVQPDEMRGDIRQRLIAKIMQAKHVDAEFYATLGDCLVVWANAEDPEAVAAIEFAVSKSEAAGLALPRKTLLFLLKRNSQKGLELLVDRWKLTPSDWEVLFLELPKVEDELNLQALFEALESGTLTQKRSAASLLGTVGGKNALFALKKAQGRPDAQEDVELRVQVERSIEALERQLQPATPEAAGEKS